MSLRGGNRIKPVPHLKQQMSGEIQDTRGKSVSPSQKTLTGSKFEIGILYLSPKRAALDVFPLCLHCFFRYIFVCVFLAEILQSSPDHRHLYLVKIQRRLTNTNLVNSVYTVTIFTVG